jgi:hypothetical protein
MNITLVSRLSRLVILTTTIVFTVPAAAYSWQDDPSSGWGFDASSTSTVNGNLVTYQNLIAQNLTANSLPALSFAIPFLWTYNNNFFINQYESLQWRNDLQGWYTNNFSDGFTSTTLTVRLTSPIASFVPMGEIADLTGSQQLPLTEPCQSGSPSCLSLSFPTETRNLTDLIPFISLGAFAGNESKRFDLSFTYTFGDQSVGAYPTEIGAYTVSAVPLPAAVWLFGSALGALCIFRKRRSRNELDNSGLAAHNQKLIMLVG